MQRESESRLSIGSDVFHFFVEGCFFEEVEAHFLEYCGGNEASQGSDQVLFLHFEDIFIILFCVFWVRADFLF